MKKFLAILLSVMLVFTFTTVAFAAAATPAEDDKPAGGTAHTYKAYQIFNGQNEADFQDLFRIGWGSGIDGAAFLAALKADETFGDTFDKCDTAADVAELIGGGAEDATPWADNSDNAKHFAEIAYLFVEGAGTTVEAGATELAAGYYLVADVTEFPDGETGTVRNLALLQQTKKGTFEIETKVEAPTVEKKVKDINDSTDVEMGDWQDSADHDIGDEIPFKLTATLKEISAFTVYKLVFHDTGCAGLAPDEESFALYIDGVKVEKDDAFVVVPDGNDFTVTVNDVIALGAKDNSVVTVEYTATLTAQAEIGLPGNPNEVYLEYSNNPNFTDYNEETGKYEQSDETGETVKDKVVVFTYKVDVNKLEKLEGVDTPLAGAGFTLYKHTPGEGKTTIGEEEVDGIWKSKGEIAAAANKTAFEWVGIDDGEYMLVETTVPNGYARLSNLTFTVSAEHDAEATEPTLTKLEGGNLFTGAVDTGALTANIYNTAKGALLPETGGIGTTVFYIVGGIMLAGAAILLITKKRMNAGCC